MTPPLVSAVVGALLLSVPTAGPLAAQQQSTKAEFNGPNASGTLSRSVRVGQTIYLAGVLGTANGALVPGGIGPETRQALANMEAVLGRAGATKHDVVQCTVFLADMADVQGMNAEYVPFFSRHRPARTALAVSGLAIDARIEIQCVAVVGAGEP